ncbi:MAG TPA: hypothetical protein VJ995_05655 [Geothermobacteraceae bacterium]|nr:hypothetical protein [Geothermobacteraceae bacterium]
MFNFKRKMQLVTLLLVLAGPFPAAADLGGFLDLRGGLRVQEPVAERDVSLLEGRLQLEADHATDLAALQLRVDLVGDAVNSGEALDPEAGKGILDLREAYALFAPHELIDLKIGRQILTWGTGDLLFVNDLFPKDWQAFFIGRDVEYLKAPSDAVLLSFFPEWGTLDIAYTPSFDADRYISGERLSYFNPQAGRVVGRDRQLAVAQPNRWFQDDELALRFSRNLAGVELAVYGYVGYWKSPAGFDSASGRAIFPHLSVYGASARGILAEGVANLELAWYDSRDDSAGSDPLVPNSEQRLLVGYERELASELTGSVQYYLEHMLDYSAYQHSLPAGMAVKDENRQVLTLRLTKLLMNQTLTLSLFGYWSPTDQDSYLRPNLAYKVSDDWLVTAGANLFAGPREAFFGQFTDNSNLYVGARYSF